MVLNLFWDALYQKQFAFGVFIDLQKAFDSVNHEIHLDKLHYHKIKVTANNWFNTFLKNRYQFTNIKESSSEKQKTTHGVPQRSVLGPLLFLLYINDLSSVHHFADDTNLLLVDKSLIVRTPYPPFPPEGGI